MLSNVLAGIIHRAGVGLTLGENLFAEHAKGNQTVVVKVNDQRRLTDSLPVRQARVQVIVRGWLHTDGYILAEKITKALEAVVEQDYTYEDEGYHIYNMAALNLPIAIRDGKDVAFSLNFETFFRMALDNETI